MKGYFGTNITCIYLDQFAASNLLDEPPNTLWKKVSILLTEKFSKGNIICPIPAEHFLESANKKKEAALLMDKRFAQFGKGLAFKPEVFVTAQHIISLLRNKPLTQDSFCDRLARKDTLTRGGTYENFQAKYAVLNSNISEATLGQNEVRTFTRQNRFPAKTMEPLIKFIKAREIKPFYDLLNEVIDKKGFISKGVKFSSGEVIYWADFVMQILMGHHQLNLWEGVYLKDIINRTGFDRIPSLDIRVTLTANLACEHKKETTNDHIDIMRLSTGLPPSDLLFTDKQRKFELEQTGLTKKYDTKVFSGTNTDVEAFYEALLDI